MADFRQLALDFVLEDDEAKLTELAQRAAKGVLLWDTDRLEIVNYRGSNVFCCLELESTAGSNPVARWVEAVQPWMPGNKETEDSQETPDWTSRAKGEDQLITLLSSAVLYCANKSTVQLWSFYLVHWTL